MHDLANRFLVVCPKCGACADVRRLGERVVASTHAQLTCTACGLTKRAKLVGWTPGNRTDWYFNLPLWLQTNCLAHTLWAYNPKHLDIAEDYISADLRRRRNIRRTCGCRYCSQAVETVFPRWMVLASHRDDVLKAIRRLRRSLSDNP
jgi:hypothetical protein